MELTGKLKEQVEKAETREEAKKIIEEAGISLTDEELDQVAGGSPIIESADYRPCILQLDQTERLNSVAF